MENNIEPFFENGHVLKKVFGFWPSFHDAEVVEFHLWRGDVKAGEWNEKNIFPVLTVKLQLLEAVQTNATGAGHDTLVTLRFHDVNDLQMDRFNHMNGIFDLKVSMRERGERMNGESLPPSLVIQFEPASGIRMSFWCFRIEVLDVVGFENRI